MNEPFTVSEDSSSVLPTYQTVVNINPEDAPYIYRKLIYELSKVTTNDEIINDISDLLVVDKIVDRADVENVNLRDIVRLFEKKSGDGIVKFLNKICNLKHYDATADAFQKAINKALPGTVQAPNISKKSWSTLRSARGYDKSYDPEFSGEKPESCTDTNDERRNFLGENQPNSNNSINTHYKSIIYTFCFSSLCFIFLSTCGFVVFFIWLVVNGKLFALQSDELIQLSATSHNSYKQQATHLDNNSNYNITINITDTNGWPSNIYAIQLNNLVELNIIGSISSLAIINLIIQSPKLHKLYIDSSQNILCQIGDNENNLIDQKNIHASIKLLTLSSFSGKCTSLLEKINDNVRLAQLEELTFFNSSFNAHNAFIMQTLIRQCKESLKILKLVNCFVDVNFFNVRNIGILRHVKELVLDTKEKGYSLRKLFHYFPNVTILSLGQQWDMNEIEYFSSATLKHLEITVKVPYGHQNVSIAHMTHRFPVLESGIIKINFTSCHHSNWNHILDTQKVPDSLLTHLKLQSNCRIASV